DLHCVTKERRSDMVMDVDHSTTGGDRRLRMRHGPGRGGGEPPEEPHRAPPARIAAGDVRFAWNHVRSPNGRTPWRTIREFAVASRRVRLGATQGGRFPPEAGF